MTFSIVAADPAVGEVGVAVQSKYFAVGTVVPWAKSGVGAVATQAAGVAVYGPRTLELLEQGIAPAEALERVLAADEGRETRQLGAVTASGEAATFTGARCLDWAGGITGDGFAAQGNILARAAVVGELARAFVETSGSLAERLVAGLEAAQAAGGDRRGQQSAAVVVERVGASHASREGIDRVVDLRVDDHAEPIEELRRLLCIQQRWDAIRAASGRYAERDWPGGIALLEEALSRYGEDGALLYDLACLQSLAGRTDAALSHLSRAVELEPGLRGSAAVDEDLAPLRGEQRFAELTRA